MTYRPRTLDLGLWVMAHRLPIMTSRQRSAEQRGEK